MQENSITKIAVYFEGITSLNVLAVCALSETLTQDQQEAEANNAVSICVRKLFR